MDTAYTKACAPRFFDDITQKRIINDIPLRLGYPSLIQDQLNVYVHVTVLIWTEWIHS